MFTLDQLDTELINERMAWNRHLQALFMSDAEIEKNILNFCSMVRQYILEVLGQEEWVRFRVIAGETVGTVSSVEEIVDSSCGIAGICVDKMFEGGGRNRWKIIGELNGQPLYYLDRAGAFMWGPNPALGSILDFWCTFPEYPPGW